MSEQHEINGALEARVAELEQRLAASERRHVGMPRASRRTAALGLVVMLLALPGVVLASHQFPSDVPTSHPFHNQIGWVAEKSIANGFDDGTYRPSQAVTRQAMAAFLQRLGTASPMEEEPNDTFDQADLYPPAGPAMGGIMAGSADIWRITHPGGDLQAETVGLDCFSPTLSDTTIQLYDSSGFFVSQADDIGNPPDNWCSLLGESELAAGVYFLRVGGYGDVPWYALMVRADGVPLGPSAEAAPERPAKQTQP